MRRPPRHTSARPVQGLRARLWFALIGLAAATSPGCGPIGPRARAAAAKSGWTGIVTTETSKRGGHLVFVREDGTRNADLTDIEPRLVIDESPSWSPDGKRIVFASTRGRASVAKTSLWLIRAEPDCVPYRLTRGHAVDLDPVWMPSGHAILFASDRGGTFDLWKLPLAPAPGGRLRAAGAPVRLTRTSLLALSPSVSPDGSRVVYQAIDPRKKSSSLWIARTDGRGSPRQLTRGPREITPAWSPDGRRIAFAAPATRRSAAGAGVGQGKAANRADGAAPARSSAGRPVPRCAFGPRARGGARNDLDLYTIAPDGSGRRVLADEPCADQKEPKWSRDGRYLFATSVFRSVHSRQPILSSLVVLDLDAHPHVLRALHDPVAVEDRIGVALAPGRLDAAALHHDRRYAVALRQDVVRELTRLIDEQRQRQDNQRSRQPQRHERGRGNGGGAR